MRLSIASTLLALAAAANAASTWGFSDASVTVSSKSGADVVEKFSDTQRVKKTITLGHQDTVKVALTTKDGSKAKKAHQAFLLLKEASGLEAPYPLTVKDSGKGTVEINQRELPIQLLASPTPLEASIVIGSFGSSKATVVGVFEVAIAHDVNGPIPAYETSLRYGKRSEIRHIFRDDPKNPPKLVSLVFAVAVLATVPVLFGSWLLLGANVSHLQKALSNAPISHIIFFGSIIAMEGVFFLYYSAWNLFQTLPAMGVVSVVAFLSGTKALGEVQRRRLAGER